MLEIDRLILTTIEKNCIDVMELLLKNKNKLCDGNWSGDESEDDSYGQE